MLQKYLIPKDEITKFIQEVRSSNYEMLRTPSTGVTSIADLQRYLTHTQITAIRVHENMPHCGKSLKEINMRNLYGINVLAIKRNGNFSSSINGDTILQANDILIVLAEPEKIAAWHEQKSSSN